jgi:glycosyltransferase involved in cell wall biosynthesis
MKVALITDGIWPYVTGGMQKHSYYMAKYLAKNKVSVLVYFTTKRTEIDDLKLDKYYTKEELEFLEFVKVEYPKKYSFPGHYIYESYLYSKAVLQEFKKQESSADIVYIQGFSGWALMNYLNTEKIKTPTMVNFHGLEMFQKPASTKSIFINAFFRPFVFKNIKLASYVQSLGGELTTILEQIKEKKQIFELGIGIDETWVYKQTEKKKISAKNKIKRFVFLGRYERRKGIEELNLVLKQLIEEKKFNAYFDFIGPIPASKRLTHPNIIYHGLIKEADGIQNILRNSDILVCPSHSEGMPTVILEAMASNCAIIATDVGAVRLEVNDKNGWLIEPANINQLKETIVTAIGISKEELFQKKKISVEKINSDFLWSVKAKKHIEIFSHIIKNK